MKDGTETKSVKELDNERRDELWRLMEGVEEETGNRRKETKITGKLPVYPDRGRPHPPKTLKRLTENLDMGTGIRPAEKPKESREKLGGPRAARSSITVRHQREILTVQLVPGTYEEVEDDLIKALMFLKEHSRRYLKLGNCVDLSLSLSRPERVK